MNKFFLPLIFILSACTFSGNKELKEENVRLRKQVDKLHLSIDRLKNHVDSAVVVALIQRDSAKVKRQESLQYMQIADSLRIIAVQNAMEGNRQARIAIQERHRADSTAIVAFQNHNEAVRQKIIAEQQRILAQQQSRLAKEEHQKVLELEKKLNQLKNN